MVEVIVPLGFFAMVVCIAVGVPAVRAWSRALERKQAGNTLPSSDVIARLDRIEQAIEVMATEVERITEGQRFVTKLLSEPRMAALPQPAAQPVAQPAAQSAAAASPPTSTSPPSHPDDGTVLTTAARRP